MKRQPLGVLKLVEDARVLFLEKYIFMYVFLVGAEYVRVVSREKGNILLIFF